MRAFAPSANQAKECDVKRHSGGIVREIGLLARGRLRSDNHFAEFINLKREATGAALRLDRASVQLIAN